MKRTLLALTLLATFSLGWIIGHIQTVNADNDPNGDTFAPAYSILPNGDPIVQQAN